MLVHLPSGLTEGITRRRSDVHRVAEEETMSVGVSILFDEDDGGIDAN